MRSKRERGETLVESMVAMAVFSIALLGILQMNIVAREQLSIAGRETKAANLARDLIDAFDRLPYHSPVFADGTQSLTDAAFTDDTAGQPLLGAASEIAQVDVPASTRVTWTCSTDTSAGGTEQGKDIQIFVTFPTTGGNTKTVEFDTYKYNVEAVTGASSDTGAI